MTRVQEQTLRFIDLFHHANGYAPTLDEMAKEFDIVRAAAFYRVRGLLKHGAVEMKRNGARTLRLTESGLRAIGKTDDRWRAEH